jgi:DNA-binding response OmpR family regulator
MGSSSLAGCSILICEDEPLIALDIADAFTAAGARVVTVGSVAEAFMVVEYECPSAVILDLALSDGESSQVGERLKERSIPFVVHSGYSDLDGACCNEVHVPKPADPEVLVTEVLGLISRRPALQENL